MPIHPVRGAANCSLSSFPAVLIVLVCFVITSCSRGGHRGNFGEASWYPEEILSLDERRAEALERLGRLATALKDENLGGVLITTPPAFSWITGGADRPGGPAPMLFVRSDGRRFVIARRLVGARLLTEQLAGQGYELSETDWHKEASGIEPGATIADLAAGRPFGADTSWPGARLMDGELAELRVPLSEGDMRKLRWLGRRCGEVVEDVCRRIQPYMTERGIEALVSDGLMKHAIQPVGVRVAADDRIRSYGAALPSDTAKVNRYVLIDVCAARWGLHVAMARAVHFGRLPADLNHSMKAVATIAAGLWARTVPAATAGTILEAAARDYGAAGFGEEWLKQDQGGAIGYREHEWLPTLDSRRMLRSPQAFAWNPGAGGVWMRDTILVRGDQLEILTEIRDWPVIEARAMGRVYRIPAILVR